MLRRHYKVSIAWTNGSWLFRGGVSGQWLGGGA